MYRAQCLLVLIALYVELAHSSWVPQPEKIPAIIETTPMQYEVQAGADVRLECKVTAEMGAVVAWYKDNEQYFIGNIHLHENVRYSKAEDSKDLIIKNAQIDDSGVFRCETVQDVPVAINYTLLVMQKPVIIIPQPEKIPAIIETTPTQYEVEAGADVRLECKVTAEMGTVVAWYKDNEQYFMENIKLHEDVRYSIAEDSKDLIIKNAQIDDSGVFRCETVQDVPVAINYTLLVMQKPVIIIPQPEKIPAIIETTPTHYEVEAGADVRLECKVTAEMGTVVAWYKDNEQYFMENIKLHEDVRYSIAEDSKDLIIKNAQIDDSGVFRCETVQDVPVAINHTLLVMQKPVIINMTASNGGNVGEGADLMVTCYVTASPVPTVLWSVTKKDQNKRLTEKDAEFHVEDNLYSIHIKNVKPDNAGQYYCYAINELGNHQAETSVVVNGKPQVHVPKPMVISDIQIEAVLQCAPHGDAMPHFRWYKDGVLIEDSATQYVISTHGSHSHLTVTPSVDGDFGTFTCEAENNYGTHNLSIALVQSPVVKDLDVDGPKMTSTVHSHQPIEEMEVQFKSNN